MFSREKKKNKNRQYSRKKNWKSSNKKGKKNIKYLTKMRGGSGSSPPEKCFKPGPSVQNIGFADLSYLSNQKYDISKNMLSDHAPVIYDFNLLTSPDKTTSPDKNPNITLITWNIAKFGEEIKSNIGVSFTPPQYHHKFNGLTIETEEQYEQRIQNLICAIARLLNENKTKNKTTAFLFCQELSTKPEHRKLFIDLISKTPNLTFISGSEESEFCLIYIEPLPIKFKILDATTLQYSNGKSILKKKELKRFEIYYYLVKKLYFFYVNVHAIYTTKDDEIVEFLKKIIDAIQIYCSDTLKLKKQNITIYIIGDFNFNMAIDGINANDFNNTYLNRNITKMLKLTTNNEGRGHSFKDNSGTFEDCNIDCCLKFEFSL